MSYLEAFGPAVIRDKSRTERARAIAWVRRSLFSRLHDNPHRSRISVVVMYAAEHHAGGSTPGLETKHRDGWDTLCLLDDAELENLRRLVSRTLGAAPTDATKTWAGNALAALERIRAGKAVAPPRKARPEELGLESDSEFDAKIRRRDELYAAGMGDAEVLEKLRAEGFRVRLVGEEDNERE